MSNYWIVEEFFFSMSVVIQVLVVFRKSLQLPQNSRVQLKPILADVNSCSIVAGVYRLANYWHERAVFGLLNLKRIKGSLLVSSVLPVN